MTYTWERLNWKILFKDSGLEENTSDWAEILKQLNKKNKLDANDDVNKAEGLRNDVAFLVGVFRIVADEPRLVKQSEDLGNGPEKFYENAIDLERYNKAIVSYLKKIDDCLKKDEIRDAELRDLVNNLSAALNYYLKNARDLVGNTEKMLDHLKVRGSALQRFVQATDWNNFFDRVRLDLFLQAYKDYVGGKNIGLFHEKFVHLSRAYQELQQKIINLIEMLAKSSGINARK